MGTVVESAVRYEGYVGILFFLLLLFSFLFWKIFKVVGAWEAGGFLLCSMTSFFSFLFSLRSLHFLGIPGLPRDEPPD